jgi:purine-binding chemotaxis protein CheW
MSLPQQFFTFYLGEHCYGIDVLKVQEVVRSQPMTRVPLAHSAVRGLINLRGQIVTAIDLRQRLHLADLDAGNEPVNIVLQTDDGAVSLLVDEIGDVLEVSPQQFELPPETLRGTSREFIRGVYKLSDRLLVILDPERIISITNQPEATT